MTAKADKVPGRKAPRTAVEAGRNHYLAPWFLSAAAMPAALAAHAAWGSDPVMHLMVGGGAAVLTGTVHHTWSRRHEHTRTMSTLFTGVVSGWVALGTAVSPLSHGMVNAWVFGGVLLSAMWDIRAFGHAAPHETDTASGQRDGLLERVGGALSGARTRRVTETPGRLEADLQLKPGETADGIDRGRIASVAGVGTDAVKVVPAKRADRVKLIFQRTAELQKTVRWPGPSLPGGSVADAPLRLGQRIDGSDLELWACGNEDVEAPRPLGHLLTTGVTGSGKTQTVGTLIVDLLSRRDAVAVVGDPEKFAQGFGHIADHLSIAAVTEEQVRLLISNLPDAVRYRAALMGELGYAQWEPECFTAHGMPLVFVDIEEAASVLSDDSGEFDKTVRTARSVGIWLCASLNTAIYTNIDRKTRGQFTNSLCHGCVEMADAKFSLSPETLEAGADPTAWRNDQPGSLYAEAVGTPREKWAYEARAYGMTRARAAAELEASRAQRAEIDPGTALHLGRGILFPDEKIHAVLAGPGEAEEPQATLEKEGPDVSQPIPAPAFAVDFALSGPKPDPVSTEAARALVEQRIDDLEAAGNRTASFSDLGDLAAVTGRSPAWVYGELHRLVEAGRLRESASGKPPYEIKVRMLNGHPR